MNLVTILMTRKIAMSRIDEVEAAETLKILCELGEAQAEIEAMIGSAPAAAVSRSGARGYEGIARF